EPAMFLGVGDRVGALAIGYQADMVAFDPDDLRILGTWVAGELGRNTRAGHHLRLASRSARRAFSGLHRREFATGCKFRAADFSRHGGSPVLRLAHGPRVRKRTRMWFWPPDHDICAIALDVLGALCEEIGHSHAGHERV